MSKKYKVRDMKFFFVTDITEDYGSFLIAIRKNASLSAIRKMAYPLALNICEEYTEMRIKKVKHKINPDHADDELVEGEIMDFDYINELFIDINWSEI